MLRIWGRLSSINVQKVVWCANELGLHYERIDAGRSFGIVDTPEYRRLNPNGRRRALRSSDAQLAEHAHVGGAAFTVADIPLGCAAHRWYGLPTWHGDLPHLRAWYERLMQRPAVQGVLTLPLE